MVITVFLIYTDVQALAWVIRLCVGQDTLLPQCLSPHRSIHVNVHWKVNAGG